MKVIPKRYKSVSEMVCDTSEKEFADSFDRHRELKCYEFAMGYQTYSMPEASSTSCERSAWFYEGWARAAADSGNPLADECLIVSSKETHGNN